MQGENKAVPLNFWFLFSVSCCLLLLDSYNSHACLIFLTETDELKKNITTIFDLIFLQFYTIQLTVSSTVLIHKENLSILMDFSPDFSKFLISHIF